MAKSRGVTFFVSPLGNDRWSGRLADPVQDDDDGPFATLARARDAIRELGGNVRRRPIRVQVRGGVYPLVEPLVLEPEDSGFALPVVWPRRRRHADTIGSRTTTSTAAGSCSGTAAALAWG